MEFNIRKAILDNINESSIDEIYTIINEAVSNKEEITLPGLGVLFETIWKNGDKNLKENIVHKLYYLNKA